MYILGHEKATTLVYRCVPPLTRHEVGDAVPVLVLCPHLEGPVHERLVAALEEVLRLTSGTTREGQPEHTMQNIS